MGLCGVVCFLELEATRQARIAMCFRNENVFSIKNTIFRLKITVLEAKYLKLKLQHASTVTYILLVLFCTA